MAFSHNTHPFISNNPYPFTDFKELIFNFPIGKPYHHQTMRPKNRSSSLIAHEYLLRIMLTSIHLDHQPRLVAIKVNDIITDNPLSVHSIGKSA